MQVCAQNARLPYRQRNDTCFTSQLHLFVIFPQSDKEDNMSGQWKHRSVRMVCHTCMWYVVKVKKETSLNTALIGRCRRRAPTMNGFPVVFESDWCGDHKINENYQ